MLEAYFTDYSKWELVLEQGNCIYPLFTRLLTMPAFLECSHQTIYTVQCKILFVSYKFYQN